MPVECDHVTDISKELRTVTNKISVQLSSVVNSRRLSDDSYRRLIMYLYSASDKSRKLESIMSQFRPICMQATTQQRSTFNKAEKEIRILIRACEKIVGDTENLLDSVLTKTM